MRSPGGLERLARSEAIEVQLPNCHLHSPAPQEPGAVGPCLRTARTHLVASQRHWGSKSTAEYESAPAPSEHHQKSGPAELAKLEPRQPVRLQGERRTPSDIQEPLNSMPHVRGQGPVRLRARAGTNVASGRHIG